MPATRMLRANTPNSNSLSESCIALASSPTMTGVIGVSLMPVSKPSRFSPSLKKRVFSQRRGGTPPPPRTRPRAHPQPLHPFLKEARVLPEAGDQPLVLLTQPHRRQRRGRHGGRVRCGEEQRAGGGGRGEPQRHRAPPPSAP